MEKPEEIIKGICASFTKSDPKFNGRSTAEAWSIIRKTFPHSKIDEGYNSLTIHFTTGTRHYEHMFTFYELVNVKDLEKYLESVRDLVSRSLSQDVIEEHFRDNKRTSRYIVSPLVPIGLCVIHPIELVKKLEEVG